MINRLIIIFYFIIANCWFNIHCYSQISNEKLIEEMLVGTWVEVPGIEKQQSTFKTQYFAPDTIIFYKNKTLKEIVKGKSYKGYWKIDKINNFLLMDSTDEDVPDLIYKILTLNNETCILEADEQEDIDDEEIQRVQLNKLLEK